MAPFSEWRTELKLSTIFGGLTAIFVFAAALAGFITSVPVFEPFAPASRGFVRELVNDAILSKSTEEKQIYTQLQVITTNILDTKIVTLTGQLQALNSQLQLVEAKLKDAPNDSLLIGVERQTEDDIDSVTKQIAMIRCKKQQLESPAGPAC